jgi:rubrerythrin
MIKVRRVIMTAEQEKTIEGLKIAIQMEIDGKKYYQQMSESGGNEYGVKLFKQLALEEDYHLQKFEAIFKAIQAQKDWPEVKFKGDKGKAVKNIFSEATVAVSRRPKATLSELQAVQKAMEMENKTRDFYKERSEKSAYKAEKEYYETLAGEESAHHAVLLDYFEYIKNPADWFTVKEHHSLDG